MTKEEKKEAIRNFIKYMKKEGMSDNTITSYVWTVNYYLNHYETFSISDLLNFKYYMDSNYNPSTANQRIIAMNTYLKSIKRKGVSLKVTKIQQKPFIENVISDTDYKFLKERLKEDGYMKYYFLVWFIATTGARASEVVCFKCEDVVKGYMDITGKGRKYRRLYIPTIVQCETLEWLEKEGRNRGYLFLNNLGEQISPRGISKQIRKYGIEYGIAPEVLHAHSFRHLFAKNFLDKNKNDLPLLSDLMGHESINSTMIYLRRSSTEQRMIVEKTVTW